MASVSITFHTAISEIAEEWTRLEKAGRDLSIQNNYLLLNAWYECHAGKRQPAFVLMRDNGRCIGIYPLTLEHKFGARVFNTLYKDAFSICKPIVLDEARELFFDRLIKMLLVHKDKWDVFKFSSIYGFDDEYEPLAASIASSGADAHTIHDQTFVVRLRETFDEYRDDYLSKKTVTDLRRLERKLSEHSHEFACYRDFDALPHMRRFYEMENTGWKKEAGSALINASNYLVYTDSLAHNSSLANKFLMTSLDLDGLRIAAQFGYFEDGVYNLLRTAYDRQYSKFAPSVLLFLGTVRFLLDARPDIKTLHYYPVSYGYKQKYSRDDCDCCTHMLFSPTLKGRFFSRLYKRKMSGRG